MVRNSSVGSSHMSGSKRPVNSVAPSSYVGPAYKRTNVGSSNNVNQWTNPAGTFSMDNNNPVIGQQYPQPINTTRINNPYGYVTNNNGYVAQNYNHNGRVMPVEGYINPFSGQSSVYRGVTRYPGHFEAVVWDNCGVAGKPETVYLGSYYREADAARAYDLGALKLYGIYALLNFPLSNYGNEVELMKYIPKAEYLVAIRRMSPGYQGSGRTSCYHGVSRIPGTQMWQATLPNPDATGYLIHLGAFDTEQNAARAYDFAAIKIGGNAAITNFNLTSYNVPAICNCNYILVGIGGAKCVSLQTAVNNNNVTWTPSNQWVTQNGTNNAVTWTPSNQLVTQNGANNAVTWTPSNQRVPPILESTSEINRPIQNHTNGLANQSRVGDQNNDRRRGKEPVVAQNPSFSNHPHQSTPTLVGNAEPVLDQNPRFSFDQSTLALDASRYTGGLEDMIRGFKFGGNDAEQVSGQNPRRWRIDELKKFLEIDTDESSGSNKQVVGKNPSQQRPGKTTPLNEFIKDLAEFIKGDTSFPDIHQTGTSSSLEGDITTLPLDDSNYCGGGEEDQTKTLFEEIDELFNLATGDEQVMRTEPVSLPDMSDFDLLPFDEIAQLDWDDVVSDDWSELDGIGELPSPSNNVNIEIPKKAD